MIKIIKSKIDDLHADPHISEVVRGNMLAFMLKVLGSGLAFGFNVAVARLLGAEGAGFYFLALSITIIGSVIGRVGLDSSLLRFVATHAALDEWDKVKGVYALAVRLAIAMAGSVSAIFFIAAPWMTETLFSKPGLAEPLRWMSLSILPIALLNLQAESLKGVKRIRDAMLLQAIGPPLFSLLLIFPLTQLAGVSGAVGAYTLGSMMVALLGIWAWRNAMVRHKSLAVAYSFKELWASCKPLFIVSIAGHAIVPFAPILLLGIWASSEDVGVFGAASRVAMLVSFILITANNVVAPKFAELYARGDMESLGRTARRIAILMTLLASPIFLALIFGGHWVMAMFGPGFENGALMLAILAMGQIVNLMTGSCGYLLVMSGNEISLRNLTVWSAALLLLLLLVFVPLLGAVGAALASAISVAAMNILSVIRAQKLLGIRIAGFSMRRGNDVKAV